MGLNMNYTLLKGQHTSHYNIPEYNSQASLRVYSESYMMQALADFSQEIREANNMISEICSESFILNEEGSVLDKIFAGISSAIASVIAAVKRIKDAIVTAIQNAIAKIKKLILTKKDELETKYSLFERSQMLKKALAHTEDAADKTIGVVNLKPTAELYDEKFPDYEVLSDTRLHSDIEALCVIDKNTRIKDGMPVSALEPEKVHVETLVSAIEEDRARLLAATFGNHAYEPTDIVGSAVRVGNEAFGSNEVLNAEITPELYGQACDNTDNLTKIADKLDRIEKSYTKEYNDIVNNLTNLNTNIYKTMSNPNAKFDVSLKKQYYDMVQSIASALQRGLNAINSVVAANHSLFVKKIRRLDSIVMDSYKVKNACHRLIRRDLKIEDEKPEVFNGHEQVAEFFNWQDEFNATSIMINEAFLEESFSEQLYSILNEDTGTGTSTYDTVSQTSYSSAPASSGTTTAGGAQETHTTTEPAAAGAANAPEKKNGQGIIAWLNNIFGKLGQTFQRFKNRIDELIIKNGPDQKWWNANKAYIKKLDLADTKANDWYNFNLDALEASNTFLEFNPTQEYMKTDEAMQNEIMKKITTNLPQFDEKDTFAQKINKIYQGGAPVSDKNGDGQTLQSLGFNLENSWNYVDGMITKGFGSDALGGLSKDYENLDKERKKVNNDYSKYDSEIKAAEKENAANTQEENKEVGPQNNSAVEEDDFRFNLAEHFCLIHHEASFVVGQQTAQSAADNGAGDKTNGNNKTLDDMIRRYFNYNTIAITAKMTSAVSAYKQYMSLFKAVYKKPGDNKKQEGNGNNQQQQQNNQGGQQNQENAKPAEGQQK